MSYAVRDDRVSLTSQSWSLHTLGELPGVEMVTYGVVRAGTHVPGGVPLLQAGDIVDGAITQSAPLRIAKQIHDKNPRTCLTRGDLVIVLVGRIGDAAVVGEEQAGWNTARSVGVVRFTADGRAYGIDTWLRGWLRTPAALEWFNRNAAGSAHATLRVSHLRQLPVPLPPLDRRRHILHGIDLIEQRRNLNTQIAARAIELADAHFIRSTRRHANMPGCALTDVAEVISGTRWVPSAGPGAAVAWVAPAEVLQSSLPHLDRTARTMSVPERAVCDPGSVLVAPRPGEVKAVISRIPVVPGRGAVALRTEKDLDGLWLLHELRSRSRRLGEAMQGTQAREMSVKALSRLVVFWPGAEVRQSFARIALPLHDRAYVALKENRVLDEVIATEMSDGAKGSLPSRLGQVKE
jgi:hypothetical protein